MRPLRILVGPFDSEKMHMSHVLLALPLVAVILIGSFGDCKYHTEGCGWVVDCCLIGWFAGSVFTGCCWGG
jgi:hypothetical protein